jgi:hypothetical protein
VSTLTELRTAVRNQMDLQEEDDLSTDMLDGFLAEGFQRTLALDTRWPFLQTSGILTKVLGDTVCTIDATTASIVSLRDDSTGIRLIQLGQTMAEDYWDGNGLEGTPSHFSIWASQVVLWPHNTGAERTYTMRGYRYASWSGVAATEVDGDERLHVAIPHYACSLVAAQLEDPELEETYLRRWSAVAQSARDDIMRPQYHEPLILNGGVRRPNRISRLTLNI